MCIGMTAIIYSSTELEYLLCSRSKDTATNGILLCKVLAMKLHIHLSTSTMIRIKLPSISSTEAIICPIHCAQ